MERPFLLALRRICERFAINKTNSTDISAYHISGQEKMAIKIPLVLILVLTLPTNPSNVLYLLHGCFLCTTNADYWDLTNVIASVSKLLD
jgi:hypothetical protein